MTREDQLFAEIDALRGSLRQSEAENRALQSVIAQQQREIEHCPVCRVNHLPESRLPDTE